MEKIDWFLDRANGIEEASVSTAAIFGADCSGSRGNEAFVLQHPDIFTDSVCTHFNGFANRAVAGIALERFSVLAVEEEGIDGNLPSFQTERENFIWQRKIVFDRITFLPLLKSQ